MMLLQILLHTPLWVWGLFVGLLALGLSQVRERRVAPLRLVLLPLALLGLGVSSMTAAFVHLPLVALLWAVALAAGTGLGRQLPLPAGVHWLAAEARLRLPGSWLPLLLIVLIFGLRYSAGVAQALHPEWRTLASVQAPLAAVFGVLSGLFIGRAWRLLAFITNARDRRPTMPRHAEQHHPHSRAG